MYEAEQIHSMFRHSAALSCLDSTDRETQQKGGSELSNGSICCAVRFPIANHGSQSYHPHVAPLLLLFSCAFFACDVAQHQRSMTCVIPSLCSCLCVSGLVNQNRINSTRQECGAGDANEQTNRDVQV
jgi:hypothetical protein